MGRVPGQPATGTSNAAPPLDRPSAARGDERTGADWEGPEHHHSLTKSATARNATPVQVSLERRLMAKVSPEPNSGCWLFVGADNGDGYGLLGVPLGGGRWRNVLAHRASYELTHGPIPAGAVIMHSCDVRCCVNPAHLRAGTIAENNLDMMRKGRHPQSRLARRCA